MTREQAIIYLTNLYVYEAKDSDYKKALEMAIKALLNQPKFIIKSDGTIEQIKYIMPSGKWIDSVIPNEKYVCSNCGGACWYYDYEGEVAKSRFCPNCGADMR